MYFDMIGRDGDLEVFREEILGFGMIGLVSWGLFWVDCKKNWWKYIILVGMFERFWSGYTKDYKYMKIVWDMFWKYCFELKLN